MIKLTKSTKIGIGWALITFSSLFAFVKSKQYIDQRRYESMKIRDRMRKSNYGEYEPGTRRFT